jgi:phenylacetate-coenzyme A ligase PaaK-like adenylate-forming protein
MMGEFCSSKKYDHIKKIFPNAQIKMQFGAAEFGGVMGYRCEYLEKNEPPMVYHPTAHQFFEIIDPYGRTLPQGEVGELVFTNFWKKASTVIRYRSQDAASVMRDHCRCGNPYKMTVFGKFGGDFLRFDEYTISTETVDSVLFPHKDLLDVALFQMHVFVSEKKGKKIYRLKLYIKPSGKAGGSKDLKAYLAEKISGSLLVSGRKTLKEAIKEGRFKKLEIAFVSGWKTDRKNPKIISHIG